MKEKKFTNLKSHDCHILMTQLLPVALRGILPENVRLAIVKLCSSMKFCKRLSIQISSQSYKMTWSNVLLALRWCFHLRLFNIMTHLLVHIVKEINILGPVFLHNMFPFERYMAVLKKYVRNRSCPEVCIAKATEQRRSLTFVLTLLMI